MVLNRRNICFGLLLVLFTTFLALFGGCSDVSASSQQYTSANVNFYAGEQREATVSLPWSVNPGTHRFFLNDVYFNNTVYSSSKLAYIAGRIVMEVRPKTTTDFFVCGRDTQSLWGTAVSGECLGAITVVYSDNTRTIQDQIPVYFNEVFNPYSYNIYFDFAKELSSDKVISFIQFHFYAKSGYDVISRNTNWYDSELMVLVEGRSTLNVYETPPSGTDIANDLLQQQVGQNQTIINQNNEYYNHEYEAETNISNQSTDDIQGATNQQTTSLISFLGSFLTSLQSVQASNCQLTLPFPQFLGGSRTVDVCDGKQYAPSIVAVASSLLLIVTFVPLAFIVLRMIYNEIRSWTNG